MYTSTFFYILPLYIFQYYFSLSNTDSPGCLPLLPGDLSCKLLRGLDSCEYTCGA